MFFEAVRFYRQLFTLLKERNTEKSSISLASPSGGEAGKMQFLHFD